VGEEVADATAVGVGVSVSVTVLAGVVASVGVAVGTGLAGVAAARGVGVRVGVAVDAGVGLGVSVKVGVVRQPTNSMMNRTQEIVSHTLLVLIRTPPELAFRSNLVTDQRCSPSMIPLLAGAYTTNAQ